MPPQLALSFCIAFVVFLLKLDRKRDPEISKALWVPTIWFLSVSGKPLGVWLGAEGTVESGSPWDRNMLILLILIAFQILAKRPVDWRAVFSRHIWLLLVVGYMLFSVIWSDMMFIAIRRWIRELCAILMGFLILSEPSPSAAVKVILRRAAYIMIPFSMVLIKYYPLLGRAYAPWSGQQMWIGVASQKNGLGRICLIGAFFLIWDLARNWKKEPERSGLLKYGKKADISVLLLSLYILKGPDGANSATSIVSLVMGIALFLFLLWLKKKGMRPKALAFGAFALFLVFYGTLTPLVGGASIGNVSSTVGRDSTLTGRTEIWEGLAPIMWKQPITGVGYGSFWTTETADEHKVNECHNGYFEVLLELGFIGLFFFTLYFVSSAVQAVILLNQDFYWGSLWLCFVFMGLLHNMTESSLHTFTSQLCATLMFLRVGLMGTVSAPVIVPNPRSDEELPGFGEHKLDTPG